jgi:site-specific DNA-cytosine methylase
VDNPFLSPSVISFCPGFLGLERGLARVTGTLRVAVYVEIEAFIIANLISGMQAGLVDAAPVWSDIKTFPAQHFYRKIHGIIGGYPCQPFSIAGKQRGAEDPRHLWPFILSHIAAIGPVWCFFENVRGHLTLGYDEVYRGLSDAGYAVECGLFTAEEVGAPHRRERLFILALSRGFVRSARAERARWEAWADAGWRSAKSEMADIESLGYIYRELKVQPNQRGINAFSDAAAGDSDELAHGDGLDEQVAGRRRSTRGGGVNLQTAINLWRTPVASPNENRSTKITPSQAARKHGEYLSVQVQKSWGTPASSEYKGSGGPGSKSHTHRLERGYLDAQVETYGQPAPDQNNTAGNTHEQLNPAWVAQLMGTTLEKTFFVPWAIALLNKPLP